MMAENLKPWPGCKLRKHSFQAVPGIGAQQLLCPLLACGSQEFSFLANPAVTLLKATSLATFCILPRRVRRYFCNSSSSSCSSTPIGAMADAVQQILERLIPDLSDLQEKGVFSPSEIKSIVSHRREHEYALHRRLPEEVAFVRAIEYELNLEALRRRRKAALNLTRTAASDHGGIRRVHFLFERAIRRFRADPRWWIQWVDFGMRTGALRAVDRVVGRALMLHPRSESLWILAAEWQFDRLAHFATARSLMTRAVRINRTSKPLWLAFFRMECVYVLRMRGRRLLLGLPTGSTVATATERGASDAGLVNAGLLARVQSEAAPAPSADDSSGADPDASYELTDEWNAEQSAAGAAVSAVSEDRTVLSALSDEGSGDSAASVPNAQADFLAGAVPRVIFNQATLLMPADPSFRLDCLRIADSFDDELGSAIAAASAAGAGGDGHSATSRPLPRAFPALSEHILASLASDFPTHALTWRELSSRPIRDLAAEVQCAMTSGVLTPGPQSSGAHSSAALPLESSARPAAAAAAVSDALDDDLFAIDTKGSGARAAGVMPESAAAAAAVAAGQNLGRAMAAIPHSAPPALSARKASVSEELRALATGDFDCALASAVLKHSDASDSTTPTLLPPFRGPLWELGCDTSTAITAAAAAAAGAALGSKRKREGASSSTAGSAAVGAADAAWCAEYCSNGGGSAHAPLPHLDGLYASALATTTTVLDVLRGAISSSPTLEVVASAVDSAAELLRVPLPLRDADGPRIASVLQFVSGLGTLVLEQAAPGATRDRQQLGACVCVASTQAFMRLGRIADALRLATTASTSLPGSETAQLLVFHLRERASLLAPLLLDLLDRAPPPSAAAAGEARVKLRSFSFPNLAREWVGDASLSRGARVAFLDTLLRAPKGTAHAQLHESVSTSSALWTLRLRMEGRSEHPGAGAGAVSLASACEGLTSVLNRALSAGLSANAGSALRVEFLRLLYDHAPSSPHAHADMSARRQAVLAMCRRAAPPAVVLSAVQMEEEEEADASAVGAASSANRGGDDFCRSLFECAVAQRAGSVDASLWLRYVAFEQARRGKGSSSSCGDRASSVYSRALSALGTPAARAEFMEAVAAAAAATSS